MKSYKIKCTCNHKVQDELYGNQVRLANPTSKQYPDNTIEVRCTVCNRIERTTK